MGIPVLIIGKSGSGKSASLRNFDENVSIINVLGKPFPFKNKLTQVVTDDYDRIMRLLHKSKSLSLVIDDAGYLITNFFMSKHSSAGSGNAVFSVYNELGDRFWGLIQFVIKNLPDEKIVYFMMHEDKNDFGDIKPKTIGKLLDEKVCLEGMFTIVLRCAVENGRHLFFTQSSGYDVAKTPMGMFESTQIDNDLKAVDATIRDYYELKKEDL